MAIVAIGFLVSTLTGMLMELLALVQKIRHSVSLTRRAP